MIRYRPPDWKNPYPAVGTMLPENLPWKAFHDLYEAGADKMLEALFEMAKQSPTGKFVIDSNITTAYGVVYDLPDEEHRALDKGEEKHE
uniref:Uncharacterized protein n=1 Tax=viral metagenome TaxID=1070528 RepID=A0A6M3J5D2_9ZZZZ